MSEETTVTATKKTATRKKTARKKAAAKKKGAAEAIVNKSQAIRDYVKEKPKAKPKKIAEELTKQGIEVSAAFVSTVKTLARKKRRRRRKAAAAPAAVAAPASDKIAISSLLSAKKLVQEVGGIDKARAALAALAKLQ